MSTIKMRCSRVSEYDSGPSTMRELQFVSTNREGQPLNPAEEVAYGNMSITFVAPNGADILHDSLVDVAVTVTTPA